MNIRLFDLLAGLRVGICRSDAHCRDSSANVSLFWTFGRDGGRELKLSIAGAIAGIAGATGSGALTPELVLHFLR